MDLTPDITIPLVQVNQAMKQRALTLLSHAGIEPQIALDAVGGAFWADILFVTRRARTDLNESQLEALGKASVALGYGATAHALLSLDVDGGAGASILEAYVQALGAGTLVFLEVETADALQQYGDGKTRSTASLFPVASAAGRDSHPFTPFVRTIVVSDFFASLEEGDGQQEKKQQAWKELQGAKLCPAMR